MFDRDGEARTWIAHTGIARTGIASARLPHEAGACSARQPDAQSGAQDGAQVGAKSGVSVAERRGPHRGAHPGNGHQAEQVNGGPNLDTDRGHRSQGCGSQGCDRADRHAWFNRFVQRLFRPILTSASVTRLRRSGRLCASRFAALMLALCLPLLVAAGPAWSIQKNCSGTSVSGTSRPQHPARFTGCSQLVASDSGSYNRIINGQSTNNNRNQFLSNIYIITGGNIQNNQFAFGLQMGDADVLASGTGRWDTINLSNVACSASSGGETSFALSSNSKGLSINVPAGGSCTLSITGDSGTTLTGVTVSRTGDNGEVFEITGGIFRTEAMSYPQMLVMRDFRRRFGFHL